MIIKYIHICSSASAVGINLQDAHPGGGRAGLRPSAGVGGVVWERVVLRSSVKLDGNAFDSDECSRVLNGNALANARAADK